MSTCHTTNVIDAPTIQNISPKLIASIINLGHVESPRFDTPHGKIKPKLKVGGFHLFDLCYALGLC
jgi:hypothetical protein